MRAMLVAMLVAVFLAATANWAFAEFCTFKHERASGSNKLCFYACPSGEVVNTIKSTQLCPLSIRR